jgi:tetratricopeptide (TPR) repeat protein
VRAPRFRYYLNVRAALILTVLGLVTALGLRVLWEYQTRRTLRDAMAQIGAFREAGAEEKDSERRARDYDLALRHLNQYLAYRPDDPDALEIQAQLLDQGASNPSDLSVAASVYEHLLRISPDGSRGQNARRHLAELYIRTSDYYRQSLNARLMPAETSKNLRYYPAELYTDQLLDPKTRPRVDDAEAHRLRAMAIEGQILPDRTVTLRNIAGKEVEVDLLQRAIDEYQVALQRDPGDLIAVQRLARL